MKILDDSLELYQKAREAMSRGRYQDAVALFERSIQEDPHFKSFELLGECLMKMNRFAEAVMPLSKATSLNKGVRAPSLLSEVSFNLADFDNAKRFASIAPKRDSNNKKALKIKALVKSGNHAD